MGLENRDFKYVLQDASRVYIGARLSYGEMMDMDEIPFKLKTIFSHYMLKEVAADTRLENHLFYMKDTDLSYLAYRQLKARFKLNFPRLDKKGRWIYQSGLHTIEEIAARDGWHGNRDEIVVEELQLGKLHMMMVSI